jgi:hypothetical protein
LEGIAGPRATGKQKHFRRHNFICLIDFFRDLNEGNGFAFHELVESKINFMYDKKTAYYQRGIRGKTEKGGEKGGKKKKRKRPRVAGRVKRLLTWRVSTMGPIIFLVS